MKPFDQIQCWLNEARQAEHEPHSLTLATASAEGVPSARTVSLKQFDGERFIFTSALWTRKARDLAENPHVSLLFRWPRLGRQLHIAGQAELADRHLAERLFAQRPPDHQSQTLVSRQGQVIDDLASLRRRAAELTRQPESRRCPTDWGAFQVDPLAVEFWQEAHDRMHTRWLWTRHHDGWSRAQLAP